MNVSLTPKLEEWVQEKVSSGFYTSSSEVIREALRIMAQFENEKANRFESLKNDLFIGVEQIEKGEVSDFTVSEVEKIKRELREEAL